MSYNGYWTTHTAWDSANSTNVDTSVISYDSENQRYNVAPITDDESSPYYQKNGGIMEYAYDSSSGGNVNLFENGKSYTASATIHNSDTSGSITYEFIMDGVTGITYENNTVTVAAGETGYIKDAVITISDSATTSYPKFVIEPISSDQGNTTFWLDDVSMIEDTEDTEDTTNYEELIQNGGCESVYNGSLSYWYAFGTGTVSQDSSGYEGNAGKVTGREKNWNGIAQSVSGIEGGVTYKVKAMVKTSTATTVSFTASIGYANLGQVTTAADTWTKIDTEWTASSGTDYTGVALYFQASDATADIYIDNVSVLKPVTTEEDPYTFETSSSFDTVTTDETTTGTLTFETTVNQATEDAVAAADVASYGYVAINFDNLSDGSTYNGENGTGITNIEVKADAQSTPTGYDGNVFNYGEKYFWQLTGIPSGTTSVGFWVVPYLKTNETSDNVHYGDAYKHSGTLSWE